MSDKPISDAAVKQLEIFGTEESGDLSPLLKPPHSKNITLADWNELIHSSDRNFADVKRVYEVLKKTLPELEGYTTEQVAAILTTIQAINTTLGQHQNGLTTLNTTFSKQISAVNAKLSANSVADATFKQETSSKFEVQGARINTAFNDIAQLNKADVAKISVEDTGRFGIYTLRITFNDNSSVSTEFDLPLEAVQIASVNDIMQDGERYLEIKFADPAVNSILVKLDEIFNIDDLVKSEVHIGPTPPDTDNSVLWVDTDGQFQTPAEVPYDVSTNTVYLDDTETFLLKLTINNLLDGHVGSFQPFDMVCVGNDTYPRSSICTMTIEANDSVKMLVYNAQDAAEALCPKYYTSDYGNVYLYFSISGVYHFQVFIRGLVEKCTGATLEIVPILPDSALDIRVEKHLTEDYVSYYANSVTRTRPIGDAPQAYGIVCRNADRGIKVRSLASGEAYADNEAVPLSYIRDTMLPTAGGGGGNANIDVTAEVGQTIIVKEVDANGKPTKWESADYQPRIAWTDEAGSDIVTIPETTVSYGAYAKTLPCVNDFKAGYTYDVYINDDVLPLVAQAHAGGVVLGNYEEAGAPDSAVHLTPNCPIGIWWEGSGAASARVWVANCVGTAQFKVIERRSIAHNPINSKLLPDPAALAYDVDKLPKYWAQVEELFGKRETVLLNHTCYVAGSSLGHKVTFVARRTTSGVSSAYTGYAVDMPYHLLFSIHLNGDVNGCTVAVTDHRVFGLAPPSGTAYGAVATYTGAVVEWKVPDSGGEPTLIDIPEEYIVDGAVIPIDVAGLEEMLGSYDSSGFNALIQTGTETSVTHIRILYLNLDVETYTIKIKCVSPSTGDIITLTFVVEA